MKRLFAIILCISIALMLAACSVDNPYEDYNSTSIAPTESNTAPKDDTTGPNTNQTFEQLPIFAVSVPTVTQEEKADDGTVIFRYTFQNISLVGPEPEVADEIILDFLNQIDATAADAEAIKTAAMSAYRNGETWNPYLCQITFEPMRIDTSVISFFGSYTNYSGEPHPETTYPSITYDLVNGRKLQLGDILTKMESSEPLYNCVIESLNEQKDDKQLYTGFKDTVKERFSKDITKDASWFLAQDGLCFYFSPYEIAPYSSGLIIAKIPYDSLTGILDDAYFPAEEDISGGDVRADVFNESDLEKYTQFSEIVMEEGSKILLHTDQSVYDIRIYSGSWSANGTVFTQEHAVFAAHTLTPGDAVMIESMFTDTLPNLQLTYRTNGNSVCKYISFDKQTNTVILIDG